MCIWQEFFVVKEKLLNQIKYLGRCNICGLFFTGHIVCNALTNQDINMFSKLMASEVMRVEIWIRK